MSALWSGELNSEVPRRLTEKSPPKKSTKQLTQKPDSALWFGLCSSCSRSDHALCLTAGLMNSQNPKQTDTLSEVVKAKNIQRNTWSRSILHKGSVVFQWNKVMRRRHNHLNRMNKDHHYPEKHCVQFRGYVDLPLCESNFHPAFAAVVPQRSFHCPTLLQKDHRLLRSLKSLLTDELTQRDVAPSFQTPKPDFRRNAL
jgi:hypothetical protein